MRRIAALVRAFQQLFPSDPSAPGFLISWLEDRQCFYVSACRFTEPFGQGRQVLHKVARPTLEECLSCMEEVFCVSERERDVRSDAVSGGDAPLGEGELRSLLPNEIPHPGSETR